MSLVYSFVSRIDNTRYAVIVFSGYCKFFVNKVDKFIVGIVRYRTLVKAIVTILVVQKVFATTFQLLFEISYSTDFVENTEHGTIENIPIERSIIVIEMVMGVDTFPYCRIELTTGH